MISVLLALLLAQTAPTKSDVIGSLNTMGEAIKAARQGTRTVTRNGARTRVCIAPATSIAAGAKTIRYGVIVMSAALQNAANFAGTATEDAYGAMEVQYDPATANTTAFVYDKEVVRQNLDVVREEIEVRASPVNAACEVALVRVDDAALSSQVRCACRVDSTARWNGVVMLQGRTYGPGGTFTGNVQAKPCFSRFMGDGIDASWPAACPK